MTIEFKYLYPELRKNIVSGNFAVALAEKHKAAFNYIDSKITESQSLFLTGVNHPHLKEWA
jgi:hypothetical protein